MALCPIFPPSPFSAISALPSLSIIDGTWYVPCVWLRVRCVRCVVRTMQLVETQELRKVVAKILILDCNTN
jgi:hypothetical protein